MSEIVVGKRVRIFHSGEQRVGVVESLAKKRSKKRGENHWWIAVEGNVAKKRVMKKESTIEVLQEVE